jgi:hypothetical protein
VPGHGCTESQSGKMRRVPDLPGARHAQEKASEQPRDKNRNQLLSEDLFELRDILGKNPGIL